MSFTTPSAAKFSFTWRVDTEVPFMVAVWLIVAFCTVAWLTGTGAAGVRNRL